MIINWIGSEKYTRKEGNQDGRYFTSVAEQHDSFIKKDIIPIGVVQSEPPVMGTIIDDSNKRLSNQYKVNINTHQRTHKRKAGNIPETVIYRGGKMIINWSGSKKYKYVRRPGLWGGRYFASLTEQEDYLMTILGNKGTGQSGPLDELTISHSSKQSMRRGTTSTRLCEII